MTSVIRFSDEEWATILEGHWNDTSGTTAHTTAGSLYHRVYNRSYYYQPPTVDMNPEPAEPLEEII